MKGDKKKNNDTYIRLLPVIAALAGVILGALLQYYLNMQTQQTLIKRQLFTQLWTLQNKLESKAGSVDQILKEYFYLGAQMPFNTQSGALSNYYYNKHLELRQEYFILNKEYNHILDEAWDIRGKIQVYFTNISPELYWEWEDVLLNRPEIADPPDEREKLEEWYQKVENDSNKYDKYVFRPFIRKLLAEMGKELNYKVDTTSRFSNTQKENLGQE